MSLTELAREIKQKCESEDIIYDEANLPIKFGPDCYIFHGTPKSEECSQRGDCRVLPFYAYIGRDEIDIMYTKTMCD